MNSAVRNVPPALADALDLGRQVQDHLRGRIEFEQDPLAVGEAALFGQSRRDQSLLQKLAVAANGQLQFHVAQRLDALPLQVLAELRHVIGADGKNVQPLQQLEPGRMFAAQRRAALQAAAEPQQPHPAAEELDDLRSLAAADVQEAHVRDPPTVPALHELLRPHEDVDRANRAA